MYYFKAVYSSHKAAMIGAEKIKAYLEENQKAFESSESSEISETAILDKYPLIKKYIKPYAEYLKRADLSGLIIGYDKTANGFEFKVVKNNVYYSQETWHFDDWQPLVFFALDNGAKKAGYISEEDSPDLYEEIELQELKK